MLALEQHDWHNKARRVVSNKNGLLVRQDEGGNKANSLTLPPNGWSATQPFLVSSRNAPDDSKNGFVADYPMTRSPELKQDLTSQPAWSCQCLTDSGCLTRRGFKTSPFLSRLRVVPHFSSGIIGTFRSNEATATRTSIKKWTCVPTVFIAIIPTHCRRTLLKPNFKGPYPELRKRNKISSLLVYVLRKTRN